MKIIIYQINRTKAGPQDKNNITLDDVIKMLNAMVSEYTTSKRLKDHDIN